MELCNYSRMLRVTLALILLLSLCSLTAAEPNENLSVSLKVSKSQVEESMWQYNFRLEFEGNEAFNNSRVHYGMVSVGHGRGVLKNFELITDLPANWYMPRGCRDRGALTLRYHSGHNWCWKSETATPEALNWSGLSSSNIPLKKLKFSTIWISQGSCYRSHRQPVEPAKGPSPWFGSPAPKPPEPRPDSRLDRELEKLLKNPGSLARCEEDSEGYIVNTWGKDTDGDGIPDWFEILLGLDPNNKDSDGDGRDDDEELLTGTDPSGQSRKIWMVK